MGKLALRALVRGRHPGLFPGGSVRWHARRPARRLLPGRRLAAWIIAYGAVQAAAPRLVGRDRPLEDTARAAGRWAARLVPIPLTLALAALLAGSPAPWLTGTLEAGLLVFGFVFAINSLLHSYLILAFGDASRITRDVGFHYMANAAGRLIGTLLSGLSYQIGGLPLCLATATAMAGASWWVVRGLAGAGAARRPPALAPRRPRAG